MASNREAPVHLPLLAAAGAAALLVACGTTPTAMAQKAPPPLASPGFVAALGRVQPQDGVVKVAGPSFYFAVVVDKLKVREGDRVEAGQVIAVLDHYRVMEAAIAQAQVSVGVKEAAVAGLRAELDNTRREHERHEALFREGLDTSSDRDLWASRLEVATTSLRRAELESEAAGADLRRARLERDRALVRSPLTGQVLKIHTRPGEKVGDDGIAELGRTDAMFVVAEVYEADIGRVKVGQRALVRSPILPRELPGTVESIGSKIGKQDVLGTDPAAQMDLRVVEVQIRLDEGKALSELTNLTVDVRIQVE